MTVSLCVVARNESAFIRACIESALPVVDEVIVVDTGSLDGTPDIARRAGARVICTPWPGDLGTAHDLPLEHARGDWILSLDGDELLDPRSRHLIPELVRDSRHDGFWLPVRNYSFSPEVKMRVADPGDPLTSGALCYYPTRVVRLHRRRPGYSNRGRLHQSLEPSIVERGGTIGEAPVPIHHYGPLRVDRDKTALYRILARRQVEDTPLDARAWFDLGMLFAGAKLAGALHAFHRAYTLGLRAPAAFMMGRVLLEGERPAAAVRWLQRSIEENARDDSVHFDLADAWESLASAFEVVGHSRRAERALARALELRAESPAASNNLAGLLLERDALSGAERILGPLLEKFAGLSTPWATLGVLRLHQHDIEGARRAFETALDINPADRGALFNLAVTHRRSGRRGEAARAFRAASDVKLPNAAPSVAGRERVVRARGVRKMPPGGIVSLVPCLHGGAGRVLVDGVRALRGRPQVVLCADPGEYAGQALGGELDDQGVGVRTVASDVDVVRLVGQLQPACVIDHWGRYFFVNGPPRVGGERWIAVGHGGFAMPRGYDEYVVLSDFHAQFQRQLPPERLHRIPNGVDLRRFRPRARGPRGPVTIAALTRLDPGKLPRQLLAYLPDLETLGARLLIAGRGPRRHELEPEIRARGLTDAIQFVGAIAAAGSHTFLANADIGLHLTETDQETCSMTVLEMLASGLPVVGQPKGCLPEMVTDGQNGYLASEPKEIAERLAELIRSPTLRARMGRASRRAAQPYRMGRYRAQMRHLVDRICRETHPRAEANVAPGPPPGPEDVSLHGWRPVQTYLICCTPRSGGNLLREALANTGIAGFPSELSIPATDRPMEEGTNEEAFQRFLDRELEQRATPNGVFGARIFLPDLERLVARLRSRAGRADTSPFELLTDALPRLRLIRLTRRDRLRQAISLLRAKQTGWWQRTVHQHDTPTHARITQGMIRQTLAVVTAEEAAWDSFLAHWPVPLIEVVYEDLVARYEKTAWSIVRQLGIAIPSHLSLGTRELVAQADASTDRWVLRLRKRNRRTSRRGVRGTSRGG